MRSRCVRDGLARQEDEPAELSELARGYLEAAASGDRAGVAMFCLLRGKLSREDAAAFFRQVRDGIANILCGRVRGPALDTQTLFHLDGLMAKAEDYLRHNVQPKQIFGLLAAETLR